VYIEAFDHSGKSFDALLALRDDELQQIVYNAKISKRDDRYNN
jgi:hypothetical protein